jgi:hypothetical protein
MAVPNIFATTTAGRVPASQLDENFAYLLDPENGNTISRADLAALKALTTRPEVVIVETGQAKGVWQWDLGSSTTADDALVVTPTSGTAGRYKRIYDGDLNAAWFGAVGDGSTDDTAALTAATAAAQTLGGRVVYLPATGNRYKTSDTIALGNGVKLRGEGTIVYPGATATNAQWAAQGSWIECSDTSDPAVRLQGNGSAIEGINFIHSQPVPGGSFTPTTYGYAIRVTGTTCKISNVRIINASHGIHWDYTGTSGGANCSIDDVIVSAFDVGLKTTNVNDVMYWSKIDVRNLYYSSTTVVVDYIRANRIGWDCGYTDNIDVSGYQDFQSAQAIKFTDGTVSSSTHSLYNATLRGVQFNLVTKALTVAATTTTVKARFSDVLLQSYTDFGATTSTETLINLGSDNVEVMIDSLHVNDAGGAIAVVGNGTGGQLDITALYVLNYSSATASQIGFSASAGALITVGEVRKFVKTGGSGAKYAGAGTFQLPLSQDVSGNSTLAGTLTVPVVQGPAADDLDLYAVSGQVIHLGINATNLITLNSTAVFPTTNNGMSFGGTGNRINTVNATHGNYSGIWMNTAGTTNYLGSAGGTADALTATPNPALTSYGSGAFYLLKATATNATTTPTLNISALGAKTIVKRASTALAAGDIVSGMIMHLAYDGTNLQLLNPVVN